MPITETTTKTAPLMRCRMPLMIFHGRPRTGAGSLTSFFGCKMETTAQKKQMKGTGLMLST